MRMRFWATIRKPAFSISALTAPVRLRSVASGLMIEKVRSIAMISSLHTSDREFGGLYRRQPATASDPMPRDGAFSTRFGDFETRSHAGPLFIKAAADIPALQKFHKSERHLLATSQLHSASRG